MAGFDDISTILGLIISVLVLGTFVWRMAVWQNKRMDADAAAKQKIWEAYAENQAKIVKEQFENSMEVIRSEIKQVDIKMSKQLKRQNRRSDFTNSNVQKVRMDALDNQQEMHQMKKALADKGIITTNGNEDSLFEREIKRKRTEIENDARLQEAQIDDDDE